MVFIAPAGGIYRVRPRILLRYTLQEYQAPTEEELAAEQRAERQREVDQRIRDWEQQA